jgi:uncharacterized repeat protein (TIGR02543 family)
MPKFVAVFATTMALFGGSVIGAESATAATGQVVIDGLYYTVDTNNPGLGAEINNTDMNSETLNMLSSVTYNGVDYKVTRARNLGGDYIENLTLSDNLIEISDSAFESNSIHTLVIPATVTTIGTRAFANNFVVSVAFLGAPPTTFAPVGTTVFGVDGSSFGGPTGLTITYPWEFDSSKFVGGYTAGTWKGYTTTTQVPLTFDLGGHGAAIEGQDVTYGEAATEPTAPREAGWTFTGWYADADLSTPFDFSDTTTDTAYAGWTQDTVTGVTAPAVTGTAQVGQTLTATPGTYSPTPTAVSYQWKAGADLVGIDAATYVPTAADLGKTITATVTASLADHVSAVATSEPTSAVVAATTVTPVVPVTPGAPVVLPAKTFIVKAPARATRGEKITIRARGLAAGETYVIRVAGRNLVTGTATKAGKITVRVKIPRSSKTGLRQVKVIGSTITRRGLDTVRISAKK